MEDDEGVKALRQSGQLLEVVLPAPVAQRLGAATGRAGRVVTSI